MGRAAFAPPGSGRQLAVWTRVRSRLLTQLGPRSMAEEELEALRKQRLAELQAKHGVSTPARPILCGAPPSPEVEGAAPGGGCRRRGRCSGPCPRTPAAASGSEAVLGLSPSRGGSGSTPTTCCPERVGFWASPGQQVSSPQKLASSGPASVQSGMFRSSGLRIFSFGI